MLWNQHLDDGLDPRGVPSALAAHAVNYGGHRLSLRLCFPSCSYDLVSKSEIGIVASKKHSCCLTCRMESFKRIANKIDIVRSATRQESQGSPSLEKCIAQGRLSVQ